MSASPKTVRRFRRTTPSGKAFERLDESLTRTAEFVAGDTATHLVAEALADENPVAASFPDLITREERKRALDEIRRRLDDGVMSLPKALVERLTEQLGSVADAFVQALERLDARRDQICEELLGKKRFTTIVDVDLSAGDTHNGGCSVAVFHTDAGSLVYKPHDLRMDVQLRAFCERFFADFLKIPRAVAFAEGFGVSEFIEKRRAEGDREARRFWHALGGLTVFAKLMGSTDLHYQNILCAGTVPYLIDLSTIESAVATYPQLSLTGMPSQASTTKGQADQSPSMDPLGVEDAEAEARRVFDEMCDLGIRTPNGRIAWGYVGDRSNAFSFVDHGLANGLTGLAVFACACKARWADDDGVRERTDVLVEEAIGEIRALCAVVKRYEGTPGAYVPAGEGSGLGGVLTGIALMRRYTREDELVAIADEVLALLGRSDFAGCTATDRIIGL